MGTGVYRQRRIYPPLKSRKLYPFSVGHVPVPIARSIYSPYLHNLARKYVYNNRWIYEQLINLAHVMPIPVEAIVANRGLPPLIPLGPLEALTPG